MDNDEKITPNDLQTILKEHLDGEDELDSIRVEDHNDEINQEVDFSDKENDYIDLNYTGDALDENELSKFQLKCRPKVIAVLGDTGSGKSTLIQSIYEAFQRGSFNGKTFHGSKTLIGFDKRSYLARLASNSSAASTPRTAIGDGVKYYHVSVRCDNTLRHIIIADRAGEYYNQCCNDPSLIKQFQEMYIADEIVLLLDGSKIIDINFRSITIANLRKYLRIINDVVSLEVPNIHINLCISKYDLVDSYEHKDALMGSINDLFSFFQNECCSNGMTFAMHNVVARSNGSEFTLAYGVDTMFDNWCQNPFRSNNINFDADEDILYERQIDYFK